MKSKKTVIVASKNPVKIKSVKKAFSKMLPNKVFEFIWVNSESWVSDQPISNKETYIWAYNRVQDAQKNYPDMSYWVGIEWGIEKTERWLESFAWVIISSSTWKVSESKTATLRLPQTITKLIDEWKELGEASDIIFWEKHSKCKTWTTGLLTWDIITRADYCEHAIVLALVPQIHKAY